MVLLQAMLRTRHNSEPMVFALAGTTRCYDIDHRLFTAFSTSARGDLDLTDYRAHDEPPTHKRGTPAGVRS
ncbi:hypothetical protein [Streptomyces sp. NPDC088847]|uniref:hypothetical protein n=1 Tax=Streptomyces sp. NPDC088847 TaxID=3365909 RepID=UPI003828D999